MESTGRSVIRICSKSKREHEYRWRKTNVPSSQIVRPDRLKVFKTLTGNELPRDDSISSNITEKFQFSDLLSFDRFRILLKYKNAKVNSVAINVHIQTISENGIAMRAIDEYGKPTGVANIVSIIKCGYVNDIGLDWSSVMISPPILIFLDPFATCKKNIE